MIKKINIYPNPILFKKARQCQLIKIIENEDNIGIPQAKKWEQEVIDATQNLLDTANSLSEKAVGLSCSQIWDDPDKDPLAIFVIKLKTNDNYVWKEFINPKIITSGHTVKVKEECLSVPDMEIIKKREINVTITYQTLEDVTPLTIKLYGKYSFLPVIIQHEYDHLNGKLII
jgi:peptide deformylase